MYSFISLILLLLQCSGDQSHLVLGASMLGGSAATIMLSRWAVSGIIVSASGLKDRCSGPEPNVCSDH